MSKHFIFILLRGCLPYEEIDNSQLLSYLEREKRLAKPEFCPKPIFELMKQCWLQIPHERITFSHLIREIKTYVINTEKKYSLLIKEIDPKYEKPSSN